MGSGIDKSDLEVSVYDVLIDGITVPEATVEAESAGYELIGANVDLTGAELALMDLRSRQLHSWL